MVLVEEEARVENAVMIEELVLVEKAILIEEAFLNEAVVLLDEMTPVEKATLIAEAIPLGETVLVGKTVVNEVVVLVEVLVLVEVTSLLETLVVAGLEVDVELVIRLLVDLEDVESIRCVVVDAWDSWWVGVLVACDGTSWGHECERDRPPFGHETCLPACERLWSRDFGSIERVTTALCSTGRGKALAGSASRAMVAVPASHRKVVMGRSGRGSNCD